MISWSVFSDNAIISDILPSLIIFFTLKVPHSSALFPVNSFIVIDAVSDLSTETSIGFAGCAPCSARREMRDKFIKCVLCLISVAK